MVDCLQATASAFVRGVVGCVGGHHHEAPEDPCLLHGVLEITISEAINLRNVFDFSVIQSAEGVHRTKLYATVAIGDATVATARLVESSSGHPVWDQSFRVYCAHFSPSVIISVCVQIDVAFPSVLGRATVPAARLLAGTPVQGWFDLFHEEGHKLANVAQVRAALKYTPATADPSWGTGVSATFSGLSNAYFPLRTGCDVTLYHDAHVSNGFHPTSLLHPGGEEYRTPRLWEDLYRDLKEAKHFIYVAGWSVNVHIRLVRDPERPIPGAESVTLGELLKQKAEEGVAVLVMPWNDRTSLSILEDIGVHYPGVMDTHDEETFKFFQGSKVKCFRCSREADDSLTLLESAELKLFFTHHQKTVSLDASAGNGGARKVVSFIGGVDLCGGRYDDEKHTLFQNLDTTFRDDFMQRNFDESDLQYGGPREPWHDIHSKLEGQAAWDVLSNFERRWMKQSPKYMTNYLVNIWERPEIFPPPSSNSSGSWSVQVFRSIDDASVVGFPSDPSQAEKMGLVTSRNCTFEQSVHSAYIEAIRRAKRFIYVENQYFFGGCAAWSQDQDCGCLNLVPLEIALKVADNIRNGNRFAAYIVTPMWPEGKPDSDIVQGMVHWNRLTMEVMYRIVAEAIAEKKLVGKVHPRDYLNFFCLGNRETKQPHEYTPPKLPARRTDYWRAQTHRRFLIYVHAKLMIVDDEYVIIGSANLNQRSLAGDRDTEIAHGSYQPAHLNGSGGRAHGDVHGFRISLWYEHFLSYWKKDKKVFLEAESLECVKAVRECAEELWTKFVGEEVVDLPGHLLPFPVQVDETGNVSDLTVDGLFPDTKAPVKGKRWTIIEPVPHEIADLLTT